MTKNLKRAVGRIQERKKDKDYRLPGILGLKRGSTNVVSVPGRPSFVYVRLRNNQSEVIQAFNDKVSPVYDLPVLVVRDDIDPSKYRIESRDYGQYSNWQSWSPYLPAHGGAHSRSPSGGGGDVVWVYGNQYMPLLVSPSGTLGSGNVIVDGSVYYFEDQDEYKYAGGTGTSDILVYKPTDGNAKMVLVYLDTNGNPSLLPGAVFSSSITGTSSILPYVPTISVDTGVPLGAVRLVSGTASVLWENLYDIRPLITGQRKSKIGIFDNSSYVTSGTAISFDTNLDVAVTGTVVFISGQAGGGGGGTDTLYYDDGVFVATGTKVSFDDNLTAIATGTTIFVSSVSNTDTPTYPYVSEDSIGVATGTHFDFGENMNVAVTGTTVFVSSVDTTIPNTDTPTYPAIWDGNKNQFIATGTSLVFQGNLDTVIATGTTVFLESNEFINSSSDAKIGDEGIELLTQSQGLPFILDKSRAIQFVDSFGDSSDAAQIYRTKNATVPVYLEALYFEVNKTYADTVSVGNMVTRIANTVFGGSGSSKYNAYTILEVDYDKNAEFGIHNADLIVYNNNDIISTNDILATGTVNGGLLRSTTDVEFDGELVSRKNGTNHDVYGISFSPLPLGAENSDDYWGGGYSTQAKTVWDMSADFTGTLPSDTSAIKAYQLTLAASDSASTTTGGDTYVIFGVDNTAGNGVGFSAGAGRADGRFDRGQVLAPCDANGDLWVEIKSTGTGTVTVYVALIGYYI